MTGTTTLPGIPQLETLAQAEAENLRWIDALADSAPDSAAPLEACDRKARCGCVICAACSRAYRFRMIREVLAIAKSRPGQHEIGNIYLETFFAGVLLTAEIERAHNRLRKQLVRRGFIRSQLTVGTEVSWDSAIKIWELHVHLLAIGVSPGAWKSLRKALRAAGPKFPLKVQRLRNPERQISCLIKFTYFRPRPHSGGARSSKASLPPDRLAELAMWWPGHSFADFIFPFGAKRHGDQIVATAGNLPSKTIPASRRILTGGARR
jgi:hypothetical protein